MESNMELTKEDVLEMATVAWNQASYLEWLADRYNIGEWDAEDTFQEFISVMDGDRKEMFEEQGAGMMDLYPEYFSDEE